MPPAGDVHQQERRAELSESIGASSVTTANGSGQLAKAGIGSEEKRRRAAGSKTLRGSQEVEQSSFG